MDWLVNDIIKFFKDYGGKILLAIVVFIVGYLLIKLLIAFIKRLFKHSKLDPIVHKFIYSLLKITLLVVLFISCTSILGLPISSWIAAIGSAGLALSLAMKDGLSNIAGGIFLLASKPFSVDDLVEINGHTGKVRNIGTTYTILISADNKRIHIPNNEMSSSRIINYSAEGIRRLDLDIEIYNYDNCELAIELIKNAVNDAELIISDHEPVIRIGEYNKLSTKIFCRVWVTADNYSDLNFELLENIKQAFDKAGLAKPNFTPEQLLETSQGL